MKSPTKRTTKKTTRKKGPYDKPISLYPLPFEEALAALHAVKVKKKTTKTKKQPNKKPD